MSDNNIDIYGGIIGLSIMGVIIGFFIGVVISAKSYSELQQSIIDKGYAEYRLIDKKSGKTEFVIKPLNEICVANNPYEQKGEK